MTKAAGSTDNAAPRIATERMDVRAERAAEAGQRSLLAVARLHSRLMRNAMEVNVELLDFARRRVGEDICTSEKLSRSRNPADAFEVMGDFYKRALKDYARETEKIVRIGNEATRRSIEETQEETVEVIRRGSEKVALPE